jgi:membrane protein
MFQTFHISLTWGALLKRTYNEIIQDNVVGLAAQLAYYFLLGLVPAIVCVLALTSFLPPATLADFVESLSGFAPPDVVQILRDQLTSLSKGEDTGLLTFGLLFALWSTSAAMVSIIDALNKAYDIEEGRPWWKVRLTAMLLTIGVAVFVVAALALVLVGPGLIERLVSGIGLAPTFAAVWNIVRWPIAFALVALGIGIIYYFAPDAEQDWEWITPGAVLATVLWLIASLGFKFYVANFANYNESYGSLGGVIVLMLWFYISALAVLTGAEMNAEIEHASPHGKQPGEKVPGQKKKIGAAARRAWEEANERRGRPPAPEPVPLPAPATSSRLEPPHPKPSFTAYAVLTVALLTRLARKRPGR